MQPKIILAAALFIIVGAAKPLFISKLQEKGPFFHLTLPYLGTLPINLPTHQPFLDQTLLYTYIHTYILPRSLIKDKLP